MPRCALVHLVYGLRFGGGIGEVLNRPSLYAGGPTAVAQVLFEVPAPPAPATPTAVLSALPPTYAPLHLPFPGPCSAHPPQLGFFVVLCLITLNIVFGIIIDTFAELREQREHLLKLLSSRCLICGMDASDFDHVYPYPCRCLCSS